MLFRRKYKDKKKLQNFMPLQWEILNSIKFIGHYFSGYYYNLFNKTCLISRLGKSGTLLSQDDHFVDKVSIE